MSLELLSSDLYDPKREFVPAINPTSIPIHPEVYNSDFAYTPEFMDEVRQRVPEFRKSDLSELERLTGKKLNIEVTSKGWKDQTTEIPYEEIRYEADSAQRKVGVGIYASNIAILPWRKGVIWIDNKIVGQRFHSHPLPLEKARVYAFNQDEAKLQLHSWYQHNVNDQGPGFFHYLRAFAIVFNNHGLSRLDLGKA